MIRPLRSLTPAAAMPPPNPPPRRGEPMRESRAEGRTDTPVPFARTMAAAREDAFDDPTCARREPPVRPSYGYGGESAESAASFSGLPRFSSSSDLREDDPNATRLAPLEQPTELRGRYDRHYEQYEQDDDDDRRDGYIPQPYRETYPADVEREDSGPRARPRKESGSRERNFAASHGDDDGDDRAPARHEARLAEDGYSVVGRADSYDRAPPAPRTSPTGASAVGSSIGDPPPQDDTFMPPRHQPAYASTEARSYGGGNSYSGRGFEYSPPAAGPSPGNLTRREAAYELPPINVGHDRHGDHQSWSQQPAPMPHFPSAAPAPAYPGPRPAGFGGYAPGYGGGAFASAPAPPRMPPMAGAPGYGAGTMAASPRAINPHPGTRPPTGPTGHVGGHVQRRTGPGGRSGPTPLGHRTQMTEEEPTQGSKVGRFAWFVFGSAFGIFFAFFATGFVPRIGKKDEASFPPAAAMPTQVATAPAAQPPRLPPPPATYAPPAMATTQLGIVIPGAMPPLPTPTPASTGATRGAAGSNAGVAAAKPAPRRAVARRPIRVSAAPASDDDTSDRRSAARSSDKADKPEKTESKGEKELGDLLSDGLGP